MTVSMMENLNAMGISSGMVTSTVITIILCVIAILAGRNMQLKEPGRLQNMVEIGIGKLYGFFEGIMGNPHALGEVFQIIGDETLTWNQIHECVGRALGMEIHPVHIPSETIGRLWPDMVGNLIGDKSNTVLFDNTKIKRAVPEFMTRTQFAQGARECVAYLDAHPECCIPDPAFDQWCDRMLEAWDRAEASFPVFA